jgi:serine/threonine protein kinase
MEGTQFEILNRVDVGGMAEIFRAKNLENGQIMAIKRILPMFSEKEDFVNMFVDEASVCMALRHPNIVRVDQIGLMDEALFLSMEYVDGINLREVLSFANKYEYKMPVHEAVRIAICVLDALEYAHHLCNDKGEPLNLIHRDVSPPNILLGYNGDVKITDFGLVKTKSQLSRTVPGLIKGKFSYLSPEAAYGESLDLRSDIYAVGIILWEMLTSRPLFSDPVEIKILDLVRKSIVPPIAQYNPDVPEALENIIKKGLARTRQNRYQTAKDFADDLRQFLDSIGNPPSELGKIIASIKPQEHHDDDGEINEDASASDDDVQPHTLGELIPLESTLKTGNPSQNPDSTDSEDKKSKKQEEKQELTDKNEDKNNKNELAEIADKPKAPTAAKKSGLPAIFIIIIVILVAALITVIII